MRTRPAIPRLGRPLARVAAGALAIFASATAAAQACPTRPAWPTRAWPSRAAELRAMRPDAVRAFEEYAFTLQGEDAARRGIRTDAVVVVHQGAIFYERYARGWAEDMPHYTWSVTKSVTNALTGIAVRQGALALADPVCRRVSAARCELTVQHLLEFSSGLDWTETYEGQSNQVSSVLAMLYGEGRADMATFIATHRQRDAPGTTFMYSSGDTTLLAAAVDRALRARAGDDYPWTLLFDPIGITSATIERDAAGSPVGSSYFYATPRDLARFGFLYLNDGCWESTRILPEGWVRDSAAVSAPFRARPLGIDPGDVQGRQFWLNRPVPEQNIATPWRDVPEDAFAARGHWGQSITIVPSLDVVVVRLADDRDGSLDFNRFLSLALAMVR